MDNLLVGTTFSGIGAPEQALKNLKIPHIVKWACDIDKYAKQTYFANHTCEKWYDDITKIDLEKLEYVDLYVFGFPCQDISHAGKQDLSLGRSLLVNYSLDIIDKLLPKYVMFENVKSLLSKKFSTFFNLIKERIERNYHFQYFKLNSKDFNIPQNRERIYGIGIRKDLPPKTFDFTKFSTISLHELLEKNPDDKYYINPEIYKSINLPNVDENKTYLGALMTFPRKFKSGVEIRHKRLELRTGEETNCLTTHSNDSLILVGKVKNGGQGNRIYDANGISNTLVANAGGTGGTGGLFWVNNGVRRLTPRECARLQGFTDSFIIPVSDAQAYKQFGNTITVNVLEAIFKNLLSDKIFLDFNR